MEFSLNMCHLRKKYFGAPKNRQFHEKTGITTFTSDPGMDYRNLSVPVFACKYSESVSGFPLNIDFSFSGCH